MCCSGACRPTIFSTRRGFDDREEATIDGGDGDQLQAGFSYESSKLLFRAFFTPKSHHHFKVNEFVWVADSTPWRKHDLDDQYAAVIFSPLLT